MRVPTAAHWLCMCIALATGLNSASWAQDPLPSDSASPEPPTESPSPTTPPMVVRFSPPIGVATRFSESHSEELRIQLAGDEGLTQARSHLTTTVVEGQVSYEKRADGWRRIELVDSVRRSTEGLGLRDPLADAMTGLRMVTQLDANGQFVGVEDAAGYVDALRARIRKAQPTAQIPALNAAAVEADARAGWFAKMGRFAGVPMYQGLTRYEAVTEEIPDLGKVNYFLASQPTQVGTVGGTPGMKVELTSFAVNLQEGVMDGVPDELSDEFIRWTEGQKPQFSPESLRVAGEGEILFQLAGAGPTSYRMEEDLVMSPARIHTPLEGDVKATEVTLHRVTKMQLLQSSPRPAPQR